MTNTERMYAIVEELQGLSDELATLDHESAALIKRGLDAGLRYAPHASPAAVVATPTTPQALPARAPAIAQADLAALIRHELQSALLGWNPDPSKPAGG